MNILIVHHCDFWGGAGVSLKICCEMLEDVDNITVCLPHMNSPVALELSKLKKVKLVSIEDNIALIGAYNGGPKFLSRSFVGSMKRITSNNPKICSMIQKANYDLVILNSITLAWLCKPISKMGIPVCVYVRETKPKHHPGFWIEKFYVNQYAKGVMFISEFDQRDMRFSVANQAIVRDAICIKGQKEELDKKQYRLKYNLPIQKTLVLYMGGMDKLKGYEFITRAMDFVNDDSIELVVAGNVDPCLMIKRDNIVYVGLVSDTSSLYRACDVLVFPSIEGHQARPAFEAGFAGLPVIISEFPQTKFEVINGYNGLTVPPRNAEKLSEAIRLISNDTKKRQEMGEKNREMALERHSFEACKKDLISFFTNNFKAQQ